MRFDDGPGAPAGRGDPTTRRRLFGQALGLLPVVRDHVDPPEAETEHAEGDAEEHGRAVFRTYREGVADLRRRERAAASGSPPSPPLPPGSEGAPRTWREGAAEVAARERRA